MRTASPGVRADAHARMCTGSLGSALTRTRPGSLGSAQTCTLARTGSLGSAQGRAVRDHRSSKLIDTGLRRGGRGFTVPGVSYEDAGVGAAGGGLAGPHALCV